MCEAFLPPVQEAEAEVLPPPGIDSAPDGLGRTCLLGSCGSLLEEAGEKCLEMSCRLVRGRS